jgi:hypothetical protein
MAASVNVAVDQLSYPCAQNPPFIHVPVMVGMSRAQPFSQAIVRFAAEERLVFRHSFLDPSSHEVKN